MDKRTFAALRQGDTVVNKVNGKFAKVIAIGEQGVASIGYVDTLDVLENGEDAKTESLGYIAAENAACFRKIGDSDLPLPVPEASVSADGKLVLGGKAVECGQLRFEGILHVFPGHVILRSTPDDAGTRMLLDYTVSEDRFTAFEYVPEGMTAVNMDSDTDSSLPEGMLLIYTEEYGTEEEDEEDGCDGCGRCKDGKDAPDKADAEPVKVFLRGKLSTISMDGNRLVIQARTMPRPLGKLYGLLDASPSGKDRMLVFESGVAVDGEGRVEELDGKEIAVILVGSGEGFGFYKTVAVEGRVTKVALSFDKDLVIFTDKMVWFENHGHNPRIIRDADAVKAVAGYPYLVSSYVGMYHFTLTFADAALNTVSVTVKKARDAKGEVTEITYSGKLDIPTTESDAE